MKKITCLIVEDDYANRKIYRYILDNLSISYDEAYNGQEAIEKVEGNQNKYNFILMDIRMPIMDGIETSKIIKSKYDIPIIICTADTSDSVKQKLGNTEIEDFLTRPVSIFKIIESIQNLIKKQFTTVSIDEISKPKTTQLYEDNNYDNYIRKNMLKYSIKLLMDTEDNIYNNNDMEVKKLLDRLDITLNKYGTSDQIHMLEKIKSGANPDDIAKVIFILITDIKKVEMELL